LTEQRKAARFPFVASAEVSETASSTRVNARVTEISLHGCYLDMINPLPVGTTVFVKMAAQGELFEASATIVYSHSHLGVGLAFGEVSPQFLATLQKWLVEAERSSGPSETT
jgi:PilZ domain